MEVIGMIDDQATRATRSPASTNPFGAKGHHNGAMASSSRSLSRPRHGRVIAGVCLGVANRFGWNATLIRVLSVVGVLFFGLPIWVYLVLWLLVPSDS